MKCLEYPFQVDELLKKKRKIKRELLEDSSCFLEINIAILGGSTTNNVKLMLELFLLNQGIKPNFYESEYNKFYEDAVFGNDELDKFLPDIVYLHTTNKNIQQYPELTDDCRQIDNKLEQEYNRYQKIWNTLYEKYNCTIIQNNFDYPIFRYMGNKANSSPQGNINYINRLNLKFAEYAQTHNYLHINDINFLSAMCGLERWHDETVWHMYKYAMSIKVIPDLAHNIARIVKSLYGKSKKVLVLDLDNTIWGGVISEDGVEGIEIGQETGEGQVFLAIQKYIKKLKQQGVILAVNSKNDEELALEGLRHPENILNPEDFAVIKANWDNKDINMFQIAKELNVLPESLVFMDDNPVERQLVFEQLPECSVPELDVPWNFVGLIENGGYFDIASISQDDINRNKMYQSNMARKNAEKKFDDYGEYLKSLDMRALISAFDPMYYERIAQLTNKSNQFNLTTRRYGLTDIQRMAEDETYMTWYGRLEDKFGDNGIVSVVIGRKVENTLIIDLWLMSCRVLKRNMEFAMMDTIAEFCEKEGILQVQGCYIPTAKNHMVENLYEEFGFQLLQKESDGKSNWRLEVKDYKKKNFVIEVKSC